MVPEKEETPPPKRRRCTVQKEYKEVANDQLDKYLESSDELSDPEGNDDEDVVDVHARHDRIMVRVND